MIHFPWNSRPSSHPQQWIHVKLFTLQLVMGELVKVLLTSSNVFISYDSLRTNAFSLLHYQGIIIGESFELSTSFSLTEPILHLWSSGSKNGLSWEPKRLCSFDSHYGKEKPGRYKNYKIASDEMQFLEDAIGNTVS